MSPDETLSRLAAHVGIFPEYTDMQGVVHHASPDTQRALLRANGLAVDTAGDVAETLRELNAQQAQSYLDAYVIVPCDAATDVAVSAPVSWSVLSEDTGALLADGRAEGPIRLPPLPAGVHELHLDGARGRQTASLIATPGRAPSLPELTGAPRTWGVVAALYGLRCTEDQGVGNYRDLAALARVLGEAGAGFLGINPVHALGLSAPETISPYSPTHRGFLNTQHLAPEVPLTGDAGGQTELLDYAPYVVRHRHALREDYARFKGQATAAQRAEFDAYCAFGGEALREFALFEHLSETHGPDWRAWPAALQNIDQASAFDDGDRTAFFKWLQWCADRQLAEAQQAARDSGMALGLYLDLAVGARLGGAESWGRSSASAIGVSLGAPPDQLSPAGQNWQLAALAPRKLQAGRYKAFRQILAKTLRHCGVLRIDHALGLSRSFWIPQDGSPGGYIRQPFEALMAVIAIEAQRAGALIVGEDLGLVPAGFRDAMAEGGLYGYTVLQYEKDHQGRFLPTEQLRAQSLACFGTHDTPTLRGFWEGRDIGWWQTLGWIDAEQAEAVRKTREDEKRQLLATSAAETSESEPVIGDVRDAVHRRLAETPSALVAAQLDDILTVAEAQNLPGTIDEHPNWRRRYPLTVPQIAASGALAETADIMAKAGRSRSKTKTRKEST